MKGVLLVYSGLWMILLACIFLFERLAGIAAISFLAGATMVVAGILLPPRWKRISSPESRLDGWMPEWQFGEFHSIRIHAAPRNVYLAIRNVTAEEIFLFRTLTWIRNPRLPGTQSEHILNPPKRKPILDVAQSGGFRVLEADPPHEIVLMTVVISEVAAWHDVLATDEERMQLLTSRPGNAVATVNFRVQDAGNDWCNLSTETRVFASDPAARRRFAAYWRVIYPGSSLIRYTWLRAIRRRAEKSSDA